MANKSSGKGSIVLEVLEFTRDGGVFKYGTYLQTARYNAGLNAILDDPLTICVSSSWNGPKEGISTYTIGRSHAQGLTADQQYELARATRNDTIGSEHLELLQRIAEKAGLLTHNPAPEKKE